ncbi:PilZ domain-containing protein [uncultured Desulfuromusa sp.]|uniref:PilZ domain-containing protein n=1 Tax=uncultured Desulfuromusa sp. TaxID=219183 RepID=UPI002AA70524|nr:PilZ domain-containing protein [uncultured Desulfuromusa sp.]
MAKTENNLKVRVDMSRNRIYCTISGNISKTDLEKFFTDVRFGVADLKPGFSMVTDLTHCRIFHLAAVPTFRKIMHYIANQGLQEVIRVINPKNLAFKQILNLTSQIQSYSPMYVNTLEEAEDKLDAAVKRAGLRFQIINKSIEFKTDSISSEGQLVDISIGGCAIRTDETEISPGQMIQTQLSLANKKSETVDFDLDGNVCRLIDGGFAVAFSEIESSKRELLQECLVQETRLTTRS